MHQPEALRDLHARAHSNLKLLIEHCGGLDAETFDYRFEDLGGTRARGELHHILTAERYWIGVIQGRIDVAEDLDDHPDAPAMESLRAEICARTDAYLAKVDAATLNAPVKMMTWGDKERELAPAHIVLRVITHQYHHQGQIAAMCRRLGKPCGEELNYPIAP